MDSKNEQPKFAAVILAGGSGTRFWPRSRRARAKQVLALDGDATMIQQTMERLHPLASEDDVWVITNDLLLAEIRAQLPGVPQAQVLAEPCARNTAPACALAAFVLERVSPGTVLGVFPSDHVVADGERFRAVLKAGMRLAAEGENIVVLGVPPTRAETGYGYIELGEATTGEAAGETGGEAAIRARSVKRFREKPDAHTAENFVAAGNFVWNAGIFLWSAQTMVAAVKEYLPEMAGPLERIAGAFGKAEFEDVFAAEYPRCENISVDYAILERRSARRSASGEAQSNIFCLPADFGWNDLGSWASLHEHLSEGARDNVLDGATSGVYAIESAGNYVYAPGRTVALLGVDDLVVVETADALLITTRSRSQDVSKLVKAIHASGREELI